jgi:tRNA-dihydrouridine synthase B
MHGRLLSQGLSGEVCWNEIKNAAKIAKDKNIVFVGNGGIKTLEEAIKKTEENRIDGVLIGQAAMGNPWVFKKNYKPSKEELFETIKIHAESAENFYGKKGFNKVLRHFSWYPRGFKNCKQLKIMLLKSKSASEVGKILAEFSAISD